MEQAHDGDGDYSVRCMAERLDDVTGCLLVGENDLMAPVEHVQSLAEILHWPIRIVPESGHAVPMENPRAWRNDLLDFLYS
jgi:pimeloyl-ACP methyl ester carboxylesterase